MDIMTLAGIIFASSGFWSIVQMFLQKRSLLSKLVMGVAFDRIVERCQKHIADGYISPDDYRDLHHYLYEPYKAMGGNGTAERLMNEVAKLPIRTGEQNEQ